MCSMLQPLDENDIPRRGFCITSVLTIPKLERSDRLSSSSSPPPLLSPGSTEDCSELPLSPSQDPSVNPAAISPGPGPGSPLASRFRLVRLPSAKIVRRGRWSNVDLLTESPLSSSTIASSSPSVSPSVSSYSSLPSMSINQTTCPSPYSDLSSVASLTYGFSTPSLNRSLLTCARGNLGVTAGDAARTRPFTFDLCGSKSTSAPPFVVERSDLPNHLYTFSSFFTFPSLSNNPPQTNSSSSLERMTEPCRAPGIEVAAPGSLFKENEWLSHFDVESVYGASVAAIESKIEQAMCTEHFPFRNTCGQRCPSWGCSGD
uniref:uncharacterized protein isoform X2 n=1 Tax=Myxine glutinosa TaxID=7769 RepID=UPI00358F526A